MTAAKEAIDIRRMCEWKPADTKKELARVGASPLLKKLGVGALAEDLFGEVPKTFLHDGDLRLADTSLDADGHGVFVIEGSLRVDGEFTFSAFDAYTVLVVTGDLEANRFEQLHDTQLIVMGATTVRGLLRIDVDDAGFALFRGPVTTGDLEVVDNGVGSDVPMFAKKPKITARPKPPKTAKAPTGVKVPSRKELETMTVDAFLALGVTGFSEVQIEGRINPNYFSKGEPGQPIEKLALMNDTYVEGFPAALAPLVSLKLLMFRDEQRFVSMLRTVPALTALRALMIVSTPITELPSEVCALATLEHLELRDNGKLTALPEALLGLTGLKTLELTQNAITELPAWLAKLPKLEQLIVKEPHVSHWPPELSKFRR